MFVIQIDRFPSVKKTNAQPAGKRSFPKTPEKKLHALPHEMVFFPCNSLCLYYTMKYYSNCFFYMHKSHYVI